MKTSRRKFLQAAAVAAPVLWLPRRVRAAGATTGTAKHLLLLHTKGGFRSHCTFNAIGAQRHNPFGAQAALGGRAWSLGAACGADPITTTSFGTLPSFAAISNEVSVIGTVDHNPGGAHDPNHRTAIYRSATGSPEGANGLLSLVGSFHPMYAGGFSMSAVPPVEINPSEFGAGAGSFATTRPLSVLSAKGAFNADMEIGKGWKMAARATLDSRFKDSRSRNYRPRLNEFAVSKTNAAAFAELLKDPKLDFTIDGGTPETAFDGYTNTQLLEILGDYDMMSIGDEASMTSWGADVAMALRFFSFGSPMAVVTRDWYDMHDAEAVNYAPRTKDLVRQFAGLNYLLHNMAHPDGGTYWDHTVVATISEFSRNNTDPGTGFNSGSGSDHVGNESGPSRNQAIALMGGPIAPGLLVGPTDDQIVATGTSYSTQRLLATFFDLLGVDRTNTPFSAATPITEVYS